MVNLLRQPRAAGAAACQGPPWTTVMGIYGSRRRDCHRRVFALNYEGEDFCQDSAWPNGGAVPLGDRGYAERLGSLHDVGGRSAPRRFGACASLNMRSRPWGTTRRGAATRTNGPIRAVSQRCGCLCPHHQCQRRAMECYGVVVSNRAYFGNIELLNRGEGLHLPAGRQSRSRGCISWGNRERTLGSILRATTPRSRMGHGLVLVACGRLPHHT